MTRRSHVFQENGQTTYAKVWLSGEFELAESVVYLTIPATKAHVDPEVLGTDLQGNRKRVLARAKGTLRMGVVAESCVGGCRYRS